MTTPQRNIGIAASISLLIYLFAVWSEAAYDAGDIGFNEELTWQRMLAAYRVTTLYDMARLETIPMGVVAVAGMLAAMVFAFIRHWTFPTWGLSLYVFALLLSGGWMGLFALVFVPFDTLDGEFLAESVARITAVGMWAAVLLAALVHRIVKPRKSPNKGAAANRRPAGQLDGSGNLAAMVAAARAFPAAVAQLTSEVIRQRFF